MAGGRKNKALANSAGDAGGVCARREGFGAWAYVAMAAGVLVIMAGCIWLGSVTIPFSETASIIWRAITGEAQANAFSYIILDVRIPRVLSVALAGAALSLCGGAMQGLLRNPLADGSTLGVSSGASLGAVIAIAFGMGIPGLSSGGPMALAIVFAFVSLALILGLAYRLDYSLSTNTIILIGVIFTMFANSLTSLVVTFAGERVRNIMFWTMGSMAGSTYSSALTLAIATLVCGSVIFTCRRELNAFAMGEDNARSVGVNVRRVKFFVLAAASALIGVCVSIGGTIAFVGLVVPHMTRLIVGPNHRRLLPASMFFGAGFLMLADLVSRTILSPKELPIGVVTSFIGSIAFVLIFYRSRKKVG